MRWSTRPILMNKEIKPLGNSDRTFHVKRRSRLRNVPDNAVDDRRPELDPSGLQHAVARGASMILVHEFALTTNWLPNSNRHIRVFCDASHISEKTSIVAFTLMLRDRRQRRSVDQPGHLVHERQPGHRIGDRVFRRADACRMRMVLSVQIDRTVI
jgi:hypothetical protein